MKASLRLSFATLVGSVALLAAPAAFAVGEPCFNDDDCPGPECGGEVCNWQERNPNPDGRKEYTCALAGTAKKGEDGWCETDDNCKCKAQGATCKIVYCSFTKASDAPAGGGSGAGGSGSGTAGTGTAGTGTAGTGTAGTGTGTAGTGSSTPPVDEGGCSVSSPVRTGGGFALAAVLAGLGVAFARRRGSARA